MIGHFATADQIANGPGLKPCVLRATSYDVDLEETFPADRFVQAYRRYLDVINSDLFHAVTLRGPSGIVRQWSLEDELDY